MNHVHRIIHCYPVTLCIAAFAALLFWSPLAEQSLYLDVTRLEGLQATTLLTGHFIHSDPEHFALNLFALCILGACIEQHSRRLLIICMGTGMASVNVLLLSPLSDIQLYCGLSGLLNTLFVVAVCLMARRQPHPVFGLLLIAAISKALLESSLDLALFSNTTWPPYAPSHLAGLAGGGTLVALHQCLGRHPSFKPLLRKSTV